MGETLEDLVGWASHLPTDWLICDDNHQFSQRTEELYLELKQLSKRGNPPKIILAEREPVRFLAGFIAACAAHCPVFLCNPDWVKQEWQQVFDLVQPDVIWGMGHERYEAMPNSQSPMPNSIMIPTGGSSGQIKFAIHTWETLMASVQGFTEYFLLNQVNSFCVLPLYHVSGLMQFLRSFTTGGKLAILPFKEVESSKIYNIQPSEFFISLVPTQLQRLLQNPQLTEWLSKFETVLLGGAPAWNELLEKARYHKIRLAPTYGMTETASQIATLKPDDFLSGKVNSGKILPHARVTICNCDGEILKTNQIGNIRIQSQSLFIGYYVSYLASKDKTEPINSTFPANPENQNLLKYLQVDDLGFLDQQGYLIIVGRSSDKIITGGENVHAIEIESAIRATEMVVDVYVIGVPDKSWGQAVTAIYIPKNSNTSTLEIKSLLKDKLSKFKIPKHWIPIPTLPRNPQGKINRQQLQQIAITILNESKIANG